MAWIKIIDENQADEDLSDVYRKLMGERGKVSNLMRAHSLRPDSMRAHHDLYMSLMFSRSNLSREEREIIGIVVSSLNKCLYCVKHHSTALNTYWKDPDRVNDLVANFRTFDFADHMRKIVDYIIILTEKPSAISKKHITGLLNSGLDDEDILQVNMIASYINFVNRIVLGLGIEFNDEELEGFFY